LISGENKNFCPHCKAIYLFPKRRILNLEYEVPTNQETVVVAPPTIAEQENLARLKRIDITAFIHIVTNSLMNIINISMIRDIRDSDIGNLSKGLLITYFCKLMMNVCIVIFIRIDPPEYTKSYLCMSYVCQTMIFISLIYLLSIIHFDYICKITLVSNILFYFGDFGFRISLEYRARNRIIDV
jgi:hypothetical protein